LVVLQVVAIEWRQLSWKWQWRQRWAFKRFYLTWQQPKEEERCDQQRQVVVVAAGDW
jgi:hypothetical protein